MYRKELIEGAVALCASVLVVGTACSAAPTPVAAGSGSSAAAASSGLVLIDFVSKPNPPRAGSNSIEVRVRGADGKPVSDATVTATFYMPAMPSMNMPEMRNRFPLKGVGEGLYRGEGTLEMGGTWNVTVNVTRGTEKLGSRKLTVIGQ